MIEVIKAGGTCNNCGGPAVCELQTGYGENPVTVTAIRYCYLCAMLTSKSLSKWIKAFR
jgi:hypothetical protein